MKAKPCLHLSHAMVTSLLLFTGLGFPGTRQSELPLPTICQDVYVESLEVALRQWHIRTSQVQDSQDSEHTHSPPSSWKLSLQTHEKQLRLT